MIFVGLIVLLAGALLFHLQGNVYVLHIQADEIRSKMAEKMPINKTYLYVFKVTLANPRVALVQGSSRIHAGMDVMLNVRLKGLENLGGQVDISGGLRYDAPTGEFLLLEPVVERLSVKGLPESYSNKANKAIGMALNEYYQKHPIYTLRATDLKRATAKWLLKSVLVEKGELVVTLGL